MRDAVPATAYLSVVQHYFPGVTLQGPGPQSASYAVTDKQIIARLAALINAVPVAPEPNIIAPCPSSLGPAFLLDFRDSATAAPAAEVAIVCFGVIVTVHGRQEPVLSAGTAGNGQLLGTVVELLGQHAPVTASPPG